MILAKISHYPLWRNKRGLWTKQTCYNIRQLKRFVPASYCDFYLTGACSAWPWSWLAIAASPFPPLMANGISYLASRLASYRDLDWHPFSWTSTPHILTGVRPAELRPKGVALSLARWVMEYGHLLHSALMFTQCKCTTSQIEKPICPCRKTTNNFIWQQWKCRALAGSPMERGAFGQVQPYKTPHFHPRHQHPPSWNDPSKNSVGPA